MHTQDFLRMFAYDDWANRECLAAMRAAGSVSADTVGRMAHILSAQKLWLERILKQRQSMAVWPMATIEDCMALADEMSAAWRNYLIQHAARLADQFVPSSLDDKVEYRNSRGEAWSSRVEDILTHVLFTRRIIAGKSLCRCAPPAWSPLTPISYTRCARGSWNRE